MLEERIYIKCFHADITVDELTEVHSVFLGLINQSKLRATTKLSTTPLHLLTGHLVVCYPPPGILQWVTKDSQAHKTNRRQATHNRIHIQVK